VNISIRAKVMIAVTVFTLLAGAAIAGFLSTSTQSLKRTLAEQSLRSSAEAFRKLEAADVRVLSAALEGLVADDDLQALFVMGDRDGLLAAAATQFKRLHDTHGITHWYFETATDATVLLRVHQPELFGDKLTRTTYRQSVASGHEASGLELGKTAIALRVVEPVRAGGKVIGYMELGTEIDRFLEDIKAQTGNEAAILLPKDKLDRAAWAALRTRQGKPDTWDEHAEFVIAASTVADPTGVAYVGDPGHLSGEGRIDGEARLGDRTYMRGAFPIVDAAGESAGAVYLLTDVTATHAELNGLFFRTLVLLGVLLGALLVTVRLLFNVLIERRLHGLAQVATRVVGGDYESAIRVKYDDEIGAFERLFEQFRQVFVDTLRSLEKREKE
jgi:HAMP domain-containing protein